MGKKIKTIKNNKAQEKNEFIKKLWDLAEKGEFRPYSEFRKENGLC